jgi:TPR repeat protein
MKMKFKHLLISTIFAITTVNAIPSMQDLEGIFKFWDEGKLELVEQKLLPLAKQDEKGAEVAQAHLGQLYLYDLKDYDKALEWLTSAADKGYGIAQYDLATMYHVGTGVDQDYNKAFEYYLKSAEQGFEDGQTQVAMLYGLGKGTEQDHNKAFYWHKKAAKKDVQKSTVLLGTSYYFGRGTEKDIKEAKYWIQRGTKGSNIKMAEHAQALLDSINKDLGILDVDDLVEKSLEQARAGNFEEAKNLIVDLARKGNTDAQYLLSKYYRDSKGLNKPKVGEEWLYKAANDNNSSAQYDIAWELSRGWITADVDQLVKIIYWTERAGYNGDTRAYANLASMYDKEHRDTLIEMEQAANNGNAMAAYNLGWINARGLLSEEGLMQDLNVARQWFKKSAKLGFVDAGLMLDRNY